MARDFKTAPSINGNAIIPTGGGSGAVLLKSSATDYNTVWSGTSSITGRTLAIGAFGPAFTGGLPVAVVNVFSPVGATAVAQGALTATSTQEFFLGASPFVHRFLYNAATNLQYRITATVGTANANAKLGLQFATTATGTYNFVESGTATAAASETISLAAAGTNLTTGFRALVAAAQADNLHWRLVTVSGAATTAPAWGRVIVEFA
jgi:hypothetical protein